jgi:hypothetical protein
VQLITSDDHAGLKAARVAVFGGIPWQRCQPVLDGLSRVPLAAERWRPCSPPGNA